MSKLAWNQTGEKIYETGVDRGVVYPQLEGAYPKGAAWDGLISVSLSPSGAEPTPLYASNTKYATLMSVEELGGTIEAYMYPKEFGECNGLAALASGVRLGQQKRKSFGFSFRTLIGNDVDGESHGYKLYLIYGALAKPSEMTNQSITDSPEAKTMSFEFSTTPVNVAGFQPTASIEIDSTEVDADKLAALEAILYGSESEEARLPLPDEVATIMGTEAAG